MPSLKEIKTRIASVQSTRKITSAMKMVASSKLHHAQVAIQSMLPYANMLEHILKSFLVSTPDAESVFQMHHAEVKRVILVVFTSNSSLCGGFNSNTIRMMQHAIDEYHAQGVDDILIYPIGRKVAEKVAKTRKLLRLTVDTGIDQRVIVSGIAEHFTPEELVGRQVLVLVNLAPRDLKGITSSGMILMAEDASGKLRLLQPSEATNNGAIVG